MMSDRLQEFTKEPKITYFSMEIGISSEIPTYSGGLGVLAGDTSKSAADLSLPMVAVTLISGKGYFRQVLDELGRQSEVPEEWDPARVMELLNARVPVDIEGHEVFVRAWLCEVKSLTGGSVPVFFLDTDLPENRPDDRTITSFLYRPRAWCTHCNRRRG